MLKHFIYLNFSKSTTSLLCSLYYKYSLKLSSFFCIFNFLVKAIFIDQTFYSVTHYLAAIWLNSKHDFNTDLERVHEKHHVAVHIVKSYFEKYHATKTICLFIIYAMFFWICIMYYISRKRSQKNDEDKTVKQFKYYHDKNAEVLSNFHKLSENQFK